MIYGNYILKKQKDNHLNYLSSKGPFTIDCKITLFGDKELNILRTYGHWFNAFVEGELEPYTEKQKLFIEAAEGIRKPFSIEE